MIAPDLWRVLYRHRDTAAAWRREADPVRRGAFRLKLRRLENRIRQLETAPA